MSSSPTLSSSTDAAVPANPYSGMLDVLCTVDVIVGTGSITVSDCLKLQRHSLIRLTQAAGSDLVLEVHGVPVAAGEAVVDDEATSLRISEVLPPPSAEAVS